MGAGELGKMLGRTITSTPEYRAFAEAERRYQEDAQARELFGQYQEAQRTVQWMRHIAGDHTQEVKKLEKLEAALDANQTITGYFDTEEKLVALLKELNEFISERLGLDFAGVTKPKSGCCG